MTAAEQLIKEGELRSKEEAREEGIEQGMLEGIKQGILHEKLQSAKNMLFKLHLDMQTVAQATGLAHKDLMRLQEEDEARS